MRVSDVLHHLKVKPELNPADFLKRDYVSSPKYMRNPKEEMKQMRVRYVDKAETVPVTRSLVGSGSAYKSFETKLVSVNSTICKERIKAIKL